MSLSKLFIGVLASVVAMQSATATASATHALRGTDIQIPIDSTSVAATRFSLSVSGEKHPAALLLHGASCIAQCAEGFRRYAERLAYQGIDAYVLEYYSGDDLKISQNKQSLGAAFNDRFSAWTHIVRSAANAIAKQNDSDGRIALVGFSQGGSLAIASAANNPNITAMAVFYAPLPTASMMGEIIHHLPPTLIFHGDADTTVPVTESQALFAQTRALGGTAQLKIYPGMGHGFDLGASENVTNIETNRQLTQFLVQYLRPSK